jgi:protoporphyrinogen/coproporphyrinogen III oxidase
MIRIAILGGGISGLTAAYELEKARQKNPAIDWHLYESSNRLGGIIQTTRQDGFLLEGGPDAWVTEKPWATNLAIELGLKLDLIYSNDTTRKTYIYLDNQLQPIPDNMRMMVPSNLEALTALENSPLFSAAAKQAYAAELTRADELRTSSPTQDESVATFVLRHFGEEVLTKIAAPILSGIFGGDVHKLSVRSVMPTFVAMEREHGSLIAALQSKSRNTPQPIFTTLRSGMESLTQALIAKLPADRLHLNRPALSLKRERNLWCLRTAKAGGKAKKHFNHILLATPTDTTRILLTPLNSEAASLLPTDASSAILINLAWPAELAATFTIPPGFGFLIPQAPAFPPTDSVISTEAQRSGETPVFSAAQIPNPQLLAATFVDQKFPHRAPPQARSTRAFFGGPSAEALTRASDQQIIATTLTQLQKILGPLPEPTITTVRHLPRSLPQYEIGHPDRIAQLDHLIATLPNLTLLGNAYRGVGLPDLIRDAITAARKPTPA